MASKPANALIQILRQIAGPPPDRDVADRYLLERFVTAQDQAAFAALVQRHGPMVLGVCRRLLHDADEAEKELRGTYKLDATKKPKEITITTNDGKTQPSIYKLDGDTLTICMGDSEVAKERPTEFATKEGTKVILFILKREKK